MSQNKNTIPSTFGIEKAIMERAKSQEFTLYPLPSGTFGPQEATFTDLGIYPEEFHCLITFGGGEGLYELN